jgi:hypothetical protein
MNQWNVIVEFVPLAEADAQWEAWRAAHHLDDLVAGDVVVDTGRGTDGCTVRRYRVRQSAMTKLKRREG